MPQAAACTLLCFSPANTSLALAWLVEPVVPRFDSCAVTCRHLVVPRSTQLLRARRYTYPHATYKVALSPFGPKSEGQVHHTSTQTCYEALVEVRVAPSGRDGRDHILSIWEIRRGDPKNTVSTLKCHDIEVLRLHNCARFSTAAHLRRDHARLPVLPILLILIGLCLLVISRIIRALQVISAHLRQQARHHSLKSAILRRNAAGCLAQQRSLYRPSRLQPKAQRWSSRHFEVNLCHHIQRILQRSVQGCCKFTLRVVVGCLRTLHQGTLAHSNSVLDHLDFDNTSSPKLKQESPSGSRWPLSSANSRQQAPRVCAPDSHQSFYDNLPTGHIITPEAGHRPAVPSALRSVQPGCHGPVGTFSSSY